MKIVFAGTPANAAVTLRALHKSGIDVVSVITRPDAAIGRKRDLTESEVAKEAKALGLPIIKTNAIDEVAISRIAALQPDLGVVVAYGAFLNATALASIPNGWINLHYSLLPQFRGAAPVQHAILSGATETGVSVFRLDSGMDTGPVYVKVPTEIGPDENAERLLQRLTDLGISALLEVLPAIASGTAIPIEQDETGKSFAPKLTRAQAKISWESESKAIEQLVRAMNPEPIAWTTHAGEDIRVLSARATGLSRSMSGGHEIGQVVQNEGRIYVGCSDSVLELIEVQPAGKKVMNAADWFRGKQSKGPIAFD